MSLLPRLVHDLLDPFLMTNNFNEHSGDRHRSTFMVRLPEVFREKLRILKNRFGILMTEAIQVALKDYLAKFGLWKKKDDQRLAKDEG